MASIEKERRPLFSAKKVLLTNRPPDAQIQAFLCGLTARFNSIFSCKNAKNLSVYRKDPSDAHIANL